MWFTEDAWSPIIVCVVVGVLFFVGFSVTQRQKWLLPVPLLLVACIAIYFIEQAIVTDTERVEQSLLELIDTFALESRQTPKNQTPLCLRFFSVRNDRDRKRVGAASFLVRVDNQRVTDVQIKLTNQSTRAITHFRANGDVSLGASGGGSHYSSRWELTWQKEADEWKVTGTKMLNVMTGDEQNIPNVD